MSRMSAAQPSRVGEPGSRESNRVASVGGGTRALWLVLVLALAIGIALLWRYGADIVPFIREAR